MQNINKYEHFDLSRLYQTNNNNVSQLLNKFDLNCKTHYQIKGLVYEYEIGNNELEILIKHIMNILNTHCKDGQYKIEVQPQFGYLGFAYCIPDLIIKKEVNGNQHKSIILINIVKFLLDTMRRDTEKLNCQQQVLLFNGLQVDHMYTISINQDQLFPCQINPQTFQLDKQLLNFFKKNTWGNKDDFVVPYDENELVQLIKENKPPTDIEQCFELFFAYLQQNNLPHVSYSFEQLFRDYTMYKRHIDLFVSEVICHQQKQLIPKIKQINKCQNGTLNKSIQQLVYSQFRVNLSSKIIRGDRNKVLSHNKELHSYFEIFGRKTEPNTFYVVMVLYIDKKKIQFILLQNNRYILYQCIECNFLTDNKRNQQQSFNKKHFVSQLIGYKNYQETNEYQQNQQGQIQPIVNQTDKQGQNSVIDNLDDYIFKKGKE